MALVDELRASGLGIQQGIDRAEELASILSGMGVRTLSDMQFERGTWTTDYGQEGEEGRGQWNVQDEGSRVWVPYESQAVRSWNPEGNGYRIMLNGKPLGHFNIENGSARFTGDGLDPNGMQDGPGGAFDQFAYSAAGDDGTEYYIAGVNPDGTPKLATRMVSSDDDLWVARPALAYAALVGGAMAAGGGAGGGAEGLLGDGLSTLGTDGLLPINTTPLPALTPTGTVSAGQVLSGIPAYTQANAAINAGAALSNTFDITDPTTWPWKQIIQAGGAIAGAASSGDQTQEAKREPWGPAQPYLTGLLADTKALYDKQKAQPFNAVQQKYMNQILGNVDYFNNMVAPGLLGWAGNIAAGSYNYDRRRPLSNQPVAARWGEGAAIPAANINFNGLLG